VIFAAPFTAAAPAGDRNLTSEKLIRVGAVVVQDPPGRSLCGDVGGDGIEDSRFIVMSSPLASLAYSVAGSFGLAVNLTLTRAAGFSSCMGKANFLEEGFELAFLDGSCGTRAGTDVAAAGAG
jgi:hypothetical protein